LVAFSDYHSHAVPFYSEGRPAQGGIARAIAYLRDARRDPDTIVVSGGDMLNRGTPTWSDEYGCVEWSWLDGLVDVMALGNHDTDYGWPAFERCRAGVPFPVIAANLVGAGGASILRPYVVHEAGGVRIGFFAVAGPDVPRLVRPEDLPPGATWKDALATARAVVLRLRSVEKVAAVVAIGHQLREDDEAMARAVPGIDVILGTHSHSRSELRKIPGTSTWFISPFQYLAYLSQVRLTFDGGALRSVEGGLVRMGENRPEDPEVAERVAELQKRLVAKRADRFQVLGRAAGELSDEGVTTGETGIGNWATEVLRRAAGARVFFSTASSFRAAIPPGEVTVEGFYAALPYKNRLVSAELSGRQLADLVALSVSKTGTDGFAQQSGVRYAVREGRPADLVVLKDPRDPAAGYEPVLADGVYLVATTDFLAFVAGGYKELFSSAAHVTKTDQDAHEALRAALAAGPVASVLDGRSGAAR
jgi:5'-nucleotidase / UDP-sugar diphosphatase